MDKLKTNLMGTVDDSDDSTRMFQNINDDFELNQDYNIY